MKKIILLLSLSLLGIGVILFVTMRKPPTPAGADIVPASTLLFISAPDIARSRDALASSPIAHLWREPEMQAFTAEFMAMLHDSTGFDPNDGPVEKRLFSWIVNFLLDAQQGELFMAVTHVQFLPPQPGMVIGADVKRHRVVIAANLVDLKGRLKTAYPSLTVKSKTFMSTPYDVWGIKPGMDVCQTFLGDKLVFTLGEPTMRDTIARAKGKPSNQTPSLADSASFQRVKQALPSTRDLVAYLNIASIRGILQPALLLSAQGGQAIQKLSPLEAAGLCTTIGSNTIADVLVVTRQDNAPVATPTIAWRTRSLTTSQTMFYTTFNSEWRQSYRDAKNSVAQSGNAKAVTTIAAVEKELAANNTNVEDDLLAWLGPETGLVIDWASTSSTPQFALAIELRDAGKLRPQIASLTRILRSQISTTESNTISIGELATVNGCDLVPITLPHLPWNLTLAVSDEFLILASSDDHARSLIDRTREHKPTLTDNPDYIGAMSRLTNTGYAYLYLDMVQLMERAHPHLHQALQSAPRNEFIDPAKLPAATTFTRHLSPMVIGSHVSEHGQTMTMISPMGSATILIGAFATAIVHAGNLIADWSDSPVTGSWPNPFSNKDVPQPPPAHREAVSEAPTSR
jgi:hypothetical protein